MGEFVLMVIGIIVGALVLLLIDYLIAVEFYNVAVMKGHSKKKYLWLSFFFGVVGYLLVVALPDRKSVPHNSSSANTSNTMNNRPAKSVNNALPEL